MPNRQLTQEELKNFVNPLLSEVRKRLITVAAGNNDLLWALRRKLYKELAYDERGKPTHRASLKRKKKIEQNNKCAICKRQLPARGSVLDRLEAMPGYTSKNTRVLCPDCDTKVQIKNKYT